MRAKSRRKIEMGERVLEFSKQYSDLSPGFAAAVARLKQRLERAAQLEQQQLDGRTEVKVATGRKRELRKLIRKAHLDHLSSVAENASVEEPELLQKFAFPSDATTYHAFRAAASTIAAEAESRKELLMKHGLSEEVLSGLQVALDQFTTAAEQGSAGRLAHVAATAELVEIAEEIVQDGKVMNGVVRIHCANQPDVLAAWESAINVVATPKPEKSSPEVPPASGGTPPAGGVRPAA
jgi:hypothetical protein